MLWTSQPKPPAKAVKRVQARRQQEQHLVEPALEAEVDEEQAEAVEEDEQMMEADADGLEDDEGAAALEPPGEGGSGDADVPLPLAAAEKKAKKQPPEEEEEEEFDDEEEEGEEQQELEQAEEQREQEQEAEVEEPAAAAGKQARQQQQQQGGQGERSAASIEDEEAAIIERQCSDANRAAVEARVFNGSQPPVMAWGCENESCPGAFVTRTLRYLRSTPRFSSLLTMLPCDLWAAIRGRTLWVAGDSQAQRFYRQLRCFLAGMMEPEARRRRDAPMSDDPAQQKRIYEAVVKGFDGCCGVAPPMCTTFVGGTRVCHARINKGQHMLHYLKNLKALGVGSRDIWTFNVGLWHHKKEGEYPWLVKGLADYYRQHREQLPRVIWRDNSPQHFDIENGEFPHPSVAWKVLAHAKGCKPIKGVELMPDGALGGPNEHVKAGGWRNQLSDGVFRAAGMPIHATWNDTLPMHDGHIGSECTHFCAPGAYNVWIWSLWRLLLSLDGQGEERLAATGVAEGSAAAAQAAATGQQQAAAGGGTAASAGAGAATTAGADGKGEGGGQPGCCSKRFSFRINSTDILVFQQIYRHHYLRALYVLLRDYQPRYILDAGANAGFSTSLFKLLFPNATIVSLEPDAHNHAALMRNTEEFSDVHRVRAGLWSRQANITQSFDDGDWGKIFRETAPGEAGLPAYSVADIAAKYNIPAFDYVKIDIEGEPGARFLPPGPPAHVDPAQPAATCPWRLCRRGAEGMVFGPDADTSWVKDVKLISLEVHDFFAKHFGLHAVTGRVNAVFGGLDFALTADNEHIFYIAPELLPGASSALAMSTQ
ncbi:hypothetical protein CHLNCDRAFT_137966 [Chlorella variabilis]|uniref:Methyltransferase FkbM domain-containing protein n=1 Tax=Chlorella variabilis TaxID=554065 RepID=E1Z4Y6_CHLVA|nr:hypothetical protein CHLNCDRAFT_137966 [Chlorella variabilis]EFN59141.1 hypothetical protein CHLNCDRAFT_137966 [Chlorella variabilis]|eukprot:XP_005851243.1 hypothetical protein CHLNCDRAFT_137966 [Chlorella variabilis]